MSLSFCLSNTAPYTHTYARQINGRGDVLLPVVSKTALFLGSEKMKLPFLPGMSRLVLLSFFLNIL